MRPSLSSHSHRQVNIHYLIHYILNDFINIASCIY